MFFSDPYLAHIQVHLAFQSFFGLPSDLFQICFIITSTFHIMTWSAYLNLSLPPLYLVFRIDLLFLYCVWSSICLLLVVVQISFSGSYFQVTRIFSVVLSNSHFSAMKRRTRLIITVLYTLNFVRWGSSLELTLFLCLCEGRFWGKNTTRSKLLPSGWDDSHPVKSINYSNQQQYST